MTHVFWSRHGTKGIYSLRTCSAAFQVSTTISTYCKGECQVNKNQVYWCEWLKRWNQYLSMEIINVSISCREVTGYVGVLSGGIISIIVSMVFTWEEFIVKVKVVSYLRFLSVFLSSIASIFLLHDKFSDTVITRLCPPFIVLIAVSVKYTVYNE